MIPVNIERMALRLNWGLEKAHQEKSTWKVVERRFGLRVWTSSDWAPLLPEEEDGLDTALSTDDPGSSLGPPAPPPQHAGGVFAALSMPSMSKLSTLLPHAMFRQGRIGLLDAQMISCSILAAFRYWQSTAAAKHATSVPK